MVEKKYPFLTGGWGDGAIYRLLGRNSYFTDPD
jgi:hypothetical protein